MEDTSRRKFVKQAAVALGAADTLGTVSVGKAAEKSEPETTEIPYHESSEWTEYYRTLE
jgi:hypothetical protein